MATDAELPFLVEAGQLLGARYTGTDGALRLADYLLAEAIAITMSARLGEHTTDDLVDDPRQLAQSQLVGMLHSAGQSAASLPVVFRELVTRFNADGTLDYILSKAGVRRTE